MSSSDSKDLKKAVDIYQQLAEKKIPAAELKLGFMNEHGIVFKKNYQKALEWYQKSVDQGNQSDCSIFIGKYVLLWGRG